MNTSQKAVLLIGAVALVLVVLTAPKVPYVTSPPYMVAQGPQVIDVGTAAVRAVATLCVTGLLWFALRGTRASGQ